jgi:hypothetical protein
MDWSKLFYSKASDESGALFTSPLSLILFIVTIVVAYFIS